MAHLVIVTDLPGRANVIREDDTIDYLLENFTEWQLNELSNRVTEMLQIINQAELKLKKKRRRAEGIGVVNSGKDPIY